MSATSERRRQWGTAMIVVVVGLVGLFALVALSTETGRILSARDEVQAAGDAAALGGAGNLLTNNFQVVNPSAAIAGAQSYGSQHTAENVAVQIAAGDVATGSWDLASRTFTPLPGNTDPNVVRAVRVQARRDATLNGPLPAMFGRAIGAQSYPVTAGAVAYIGWAGAAGPGTVDLPIAIDCCAISGNTPGSACTQNYCQTIQTTPPNPCPRQRDGVMVTCLEFFATPQQNACWSEFDPDSPSVTSPGLQDIVRSGNAGTIGSEPIYIDNGTKTPVVREIRDRFLGLGAYSGNPSGTDTNGDGTIDSWVVSLPTVECQNPGDQCAGGATADIVGFVCIDIQEVEVTPDKIIRGQFLCASDPRCSNSGMGPGGTIPGTLSAQWPVLVR